MSETDVEMAKYYIDDVYKDLKDLILEKNDIAYQITAGELLKYCIDLFFKINRTIKEKNKRIPKQLLNIDEKFYYIIQKVIKSHFDIVEVKKLVNYSENSLKGRRTLEWKLKSNLRIIKN
ncbi:hypothetical protein LCGC14_2591580 [marine sediment metagenome]|uniref:Uncharacterized protein n=1 Tax=marine sediment metagenome TaxID=412755 RepID=A0A0F9ABR8_9ZZZZ